MTIHELDIGVYSFEYDEEEMRNTPDELNMLEVQLKNPDDFLKIKETLTRIGIPSFTKKVLYQSCHIFHKQGRYYIAHFKEIFALDGKPHDLLHEDIYRRNLVVKLLVDWGLCTPVGYKIQDLELGDVIAKTKILKHHEKNDWRLESKHSLGKVH